MALSEVTTLTLTGQVGSFTAQTLLAAGSNTGGIFRVSMYLSAASIGVNQTLSVNCNYTDDNAAQNTNVIIIGPPSGSSAYTNVRSKVVEFFRSAASTAITIQPGADFSDPTDTFNLYAALEQL